jgi:hypothetical protein
MVRQVTPQSTLENLKKEAKRWLQALRGSDPGGQREARARLERSVPDAPPAPALRHVQHALAREHGQPGWAALKSLLASRAEDDAEPSDRVKWFIENGFRDLKFVV